MPLITKYFRNGVLLLLLVTAIVGFAFVAPHLRWFTGIDRTVERIEKRDRIDDIGAALRAHVLRCGQTSATEFLAKLTYASRYKIVTNNTASFRADELVLLYDILEEQHYQQMVPIAVVIDDELSAECRSVFVMFSVFATPKYLEMSLPELHEFVMISDPVAALERINTVGRQGCGEP